jgi:hypothetical protein
VALDASLGKSFFNFYFANRWGFAIVIFGIRRRYGPQQFTETPRSLKFKVRPLGGLIFRWVCRLSIFFIAALRYWLLKLTAFYVLLLCCKFETNQYWILREKRFFLKTQLHPSVIAHILVTWNRLPQVLPDGTAHSRPTTAFVLISLPLSLLVAVSFRPKLTTVKNMLWFYLFCYSKLSTNASNKEFHSSRGASLGHIVFKL